MAKKPTSQPNSKFPTDGSFYFQKIAKIGNALGINRESQEAAKKWFMAQAKNLTGVSANEMMREDPERFLRTNRIGPGTVGKMVLFFYDPKHKKTLPYYDRFPCIFPIEEKKPGKEGPGFLGINLHYLSPYQRAKLLDAMYKAYVINAGTDRQKLKISYGILKGAAAMNTFKPCVKHYLYSQIRSKFYVVRYNEWDTVVMLPTERFEKGGKGSGGNFGGAISKNKVWSDSMNKARR